MIYHAGNMELDPIGEVFHGAVNDVLICRDANAPASTRYLLLVIHDRECVKRLLPVFECGEAPSPTGEPPYLVRFTQNDLLCYVFPCREERRLSAFAPGQLTSAVIRERVCINLVIECMSSPLPYPLLYLMLRQSCIHLEKDNSVYLIPTLDLSELDPAKEEGDCAAECAQVLLELLEGGGRRRRPLKSYELIRKKLAKHAYSGFPELYHDIKVTAIPEHKPGLRARLKGFWIRNKDLIFRILLVLCVILVVLALIFALSQLIFGDIPLLRLFERAFEVIGTETLK